MRPLKIAMQGTVSSFHHQAANLYFKEDVELVECNTFKNVCERLATNEIDYAIMAIENSIAGSILNNYNLIKDYQFCINGEIYLQIAFHLLVNKGVKMEDVRYIESHPMAIAECSGFLAEQNGIEIIAGQDTATVAKKIKAEKNYDRAAIASSVSADAYNLEIIRHHIGDCEQNYTRFLVIAKQHAYSGKSDKSTICFQLPHSLGKLAEILKMISDYNVNLTKIQSVPVIGKLNEYAFYLDMEWKSAYEHEALLEKIKLNTLHFSVLGKYKKHDLLQILNNGN